MAAALLAVIVPISIRSLILPSSIESTTPLNLVFDACEDQVGLLILAYRLQLTFFFPFGILYTLRYWKNRVEGMIVSGLSFFSFCLCLLLWLWFVSEQYSCNLCEDQVRLALPCSTCAPLWLGPTRKKVGIFATKFQLY